MLPGFIRLADYMVVEGLMLLAVGTGDTPFCHCTCNCFQLG
jgi:hypothetical protein